MCGELMIRVTGKMGLHADAGAPSAIRKIRTNSASGFDKADHMAAGVRTGYAFQLMYEILGNRHIIERPKQDE
jgi:hypothetical protein